MTLSASLASSAPAGRGKADAKHNLGRRPLQLIFFFQLTFQFFSFN